MKNINVRSYNLGLYEVPHETFGGVCLDVGANVGSFLKKYVNHFRKIHYYEPLDRCFKICQDFSKNYSHIHGFNKAGYSVSGKRLRMISHLNLDSGSCAVESELLNDDWDINNMINCVESICLEDMIKELDEPVIDYLKMDCETSEYHILFEKDLTIFNYIGIEVHAQPGELKHSQLISHIKTTHQLVSGDATYKSNLNNELFFKRLE